MKEFVIELLYDDLSSTSFKVLVNGDEYEYIAILNMVTRGTLMASSARWAICWEDEEHSLCSFVK